jgi:hypothetical protein
MAWTTITGIDLRQTVAFVSDPAGDVCLPQHNSSANVLPPYSGTGTLRRAWSQCENPSTPCNGRPQLQLHPRCEMLRKGFRGRYQFRRVRIAGSAERYHDTPDKNEYSDCHDALQYVGTAVFGGVVRGRQEGQQGMKLEPLEKLYPHWAEQMRKAMR